MTDGASFSEEELNDCVAAYQQYGSKIAASQALNMDYRSFRRRIDRAAELGMLIDHKPAMPGFVITNTSETQAADGSVTSRTIRQAKDPGNLEPYKQPVGTVVGKITHHVDGEGNLLQQWIRTRPDDAQGIVEALKEVFSEYKGVVPLIDPPSFTDDNLLTIYPIADQHNGLLAWGRETGEAYDLKIGIERLMSCASSLVAQSKPSKYAIILNLGDWQHTDDSSNETPAHHNKLDVDSRYKKILVAGVRLMKSIIDLALQKHEKVIVVNIPGNHDIHSSVALDVAIEESYENNPRVETGETIADCYFYRFGSTLIGATHGHKIKKPADMAMTMAVRCRADWGQTKYHYFYFGHIHHETVKEVGDVRVESFQTLAANDAHHAASGYTSGKSLNAITIDKNGGEVGRHRVNLPPPIWRADVTQEAA